MRQLKFLVATLAGAMFLNVALAQPTAADVATKFNEAAELVNTRKFAEAIPVLQATVEMGIEIPEALETVQQAQTLIPTCYYQDGMGMARANNYEGAAAQFTKALQTAELYGNAQVMGTAKQRLGQVLGVQGGQAYNAGDFAKAVEVYGKVLEVNPKDGKTALLLAAAYDKNGQADKALETYNQVIALGGEEAVSAKEQVANYQLIALNEAVTAKDWAKVIELGDAAAEAQVSDEARSNVYFTLGAAYNNVENKAKAIETFRKVTAGPNVAAARAQIAELSK